MTTRALVPVSLMVNLVLGIIAWHLMHDSSARLGTAERTVVFNNGPLRTSTNGLRIDITITNSAPLFRWQNLPRDSYTNYIAGLRIVGCPEQTIRDLVTAELTEEFLRRRRALLAPLQADYWSHAVHGFSKILEDYKKKIDVIHEQTIGQIDILLPPEKKGPVYFSINPVQIEHLAAGKLGAVKALYERFNLAAAKFMDDPAVTKAEKDRQKNVLQQQLDGDLKKLMTPEDYAEMQLRGSAHVQSLRDLVGVDLSPEEMRAMVSLLDRYDKASGGPKPGQLGPDQKKAQEQEIHEILGDRYENYLRAQDSGYAQAYRVARRFDLPVEAANQVDDVRKSVSDAAKTLQSNARLTRDQRREALLAVQRQAESTVREILGEKAATAYQHVGGDWMKNLPPDQSNP